MVLRCGPSEGFWERINGVFGVNRAANLGWQAFCYPKVPRSPIGALNMIESDIKTHDADDVDSNIWPVVQAIGFVTAIILWGIAAFALAGMF